MIAAEKTSPLSLSFSLGQNKMEQQTSYPPEINEAEQRTKRVIFASLIGGGRGTGSKFSIYFVACVQTTPIPLFHRCTHFAAMEQESSARRLY